MNNTKYNVCCIIVTYNAMPWIDKCLSSLRESETYITPIVIDNLSIDQTVFHIKKYYPEAYVIENTVNKGFGQANNQGIEYAYSKGCRYFFLLNQDAFICPDTLQFLVDALEDEQIAIASPVHLNAKGNKLDLGFFDGAVVKGKNIDYVSDLILGKVSSCYSVPFINAAAWLLPRRSIELIGGFDPVFFHYGEDVNFCQRVQYHKKQITVVPKSFIHHCRKEGEAGNQLVYNKRRYVMNLLITLADPNKKNSICNVLFSPHQVYYMFRLLLSFKFDALNCFFSAYKEILTRHKQITNNRAENQKVQSNWLTLEQVQS